MPTPKSLLITTGGTPEPPILDHPATRHRVVGADMYDLAGIELGPYAGLLLPIGSDQRELTRLGAKLQAFLADGRTVVFCGHVAYPFLPYLADFVPLGTYRLDDLRVHRVRGHPAFAGVNTEHLTFRKGVAGFYGRGHNPPPAGAVVLHALGLRQAPVDFVYEPPGGGRLLVHAGVDLWGYVADDSTTTAARIAVQLLDWIDAHVTAQVR